jgi:hypothetical protein
MRAWEVVGKRAKRRPRRRCPWCSKLVGIDRLGRHVRHGGIDGCRGAYQMSRPLTTAVEKTAH